MRDWLNFLVFLLKHLFKLNVKETRAKIKEIRSFKRAFSQYTDQWGCRCCGRSQNEQICLLQNAEFYNTELKNADLIFAAAVDL